MKFLVFAVALCLAVTTVYGNPKRVKCYVCQWTSKTGYTSPFSQNDCTDAGLAKFPRAFVQECDNGCTVSVTKEGSTITSYSRGCSAAAENKYTKTRLCSGDDCNKDWTTKSAVLPNYTKSKCRQASGGPWVVNYTSIYQNDSRVAANCTGNDPEKHYYCMISVTKKDKLAGQMFSSYADSYMLGCTDVIKAQWSGLEYDAETKTCMNDFCNRKLDDSASDPTTTVEPSTTPEPTKTGSSSRPAVIFIMLMTLLGYLV